MIKPITVAYNDFEDDLVNLINQTNLPAFAMSALLQKYLKQLESLHTVQYEEDKQKWEKTQSEITPRPASEEETSQILDILNNVVNDKEK